MANINELQAELTEATNELIKCNDEKTRLEYHISHLKSIVRNRRDAIKSLRSIDSKPSVYIHVEDWSDFNNRFTEFETTVTSLDELKIPDKILKFAEDGDSYASAECYYGADNYSVTFSMDFKLLTQGFANGKVQFKAYGKNTFLSPVVEDPTYIDALQFFFKSVPVTNDYHHIYLECIEEEKKSSTDEVRVYVFHAGS